MKVILQAHREGHLSVLPLQVEPFLMRPLVYPGWVTQPSAVLLLPSPWPGRIKKVQPNFVLQRPWEHRVFLWSKTEHWEALYSPLCCLAETDKPKVNFGAPFPGGRPRHPEEHRPIQIPRALRALQGLVSSSPGGDVPRAVPSPDPVRGAAGPGAARGQGRASRCPRCWTRPGAGLQHPPLRGLPRAPPAPGPAHVPAGSGRVRGSFRGGRITAANWTGLEEKKWDLRGEQGAPHSHVPAAVAARLGTGETAQPSMNIWVQAGPFPWRFRCMHPDIQPTDMAWMTNGTRSPTPATRRHVGESPRAWDACLRHWSQILALQGHQDPMVVFML